MAGNGFEISFYNDETGQWEVAPAPSAKPLAVRKKKAAQAKGPSAGDYLATLGDMLVVNPRNSPAATLGGAAYDYVTKSTPQSVVRDIRSSAQGARDWLRKENKALRDAPITETLRLLKAGYIDPLADPYRVFKQAATERARGNTSGAEKLAAMVPLSVAGVVNPQLRGAGKVAAKAGVEAATKTATKKATKKAAKGEPKPRKAKYQPVEPVEKPHPELADVEFPSGSGKGGAFAIERKVPIVGRRPFIAQSPGGYSRLAGGLPANQVTVESKPFVEMPERQFLDPHDLVKEFRSIVPFIGDKLRGGEDIITIAGRPQEGYSRAHSGPDFARQQMGAGGREVWASGPSVISGLDRMALEGQEKFGGPVAGVYTTMGPEALDQTTAMMEQIGRQIAAGGASPKDVRAFDDAIRTASRKDDEAIPDFVGFANDPMEAIRQLNDVKNVSMGQRRTLTQMMNAKPWLEAGLPDIGANRAGLTIPELLYAPEGTSGFAISALEPGKGALPDEAVSLAHPNYLKKLGGTYLGGFEVGVPRELVWSKLYGHPEMQKYEQFRQLGYLFGRPPKEIRADFGHDPRIQPIDEQWADQIAEYIDAVRKYGEEPYASGGLAVRKKRAFAAKAK
jgi:hypothetical protein